jgi:hypothetical protein
VVVVGSAVVVVVVGAVVVVVGAVVVVVGAVVVVVGRVVEVVDVEVVEVVDVVVEVWGTVFGGPESSSSRRANQISTPAAITMAAISATSAAVPHPERSDGPGGGPAGPSP